METLVETLRTLLAKNIVRFTFRKVDGTIRKAIGTRNLDLARQYALANPSIQYCDIPTPRGEEKPYSYFDLDKMEWRGYCPQNLISIEGVVEISTRYAKEIPISKGVKVELPPCFGKGTAEKISKEIEKIGGGMPSHTDGLPMSEISKGGFGGGMPLGGFGGGAELPKGGKVGKPTDVGYGIALPISGVGGGEITIDDFAKLVAKYVVDLLAHRLSE